MAKKTAAKTYKKKWDAANKEAKKERAEQTKASAGKKAPPKPN